MLGKLFTTFFKIGLFTIGGGYVMIPLIEKEVVERNKWIDSQEFSDILAISQAAPGIFAANISIFIGYKLKGIKGSIACTAGTVLPSVTIILLIALFFQRFKEIPLVENIFKGIRPAVIALILTPALRLAGHADLDRRTIWIPVASALAIWLLGVSPIYIIAAAIAGVILYHFYKRRSRL
ncbi:MAG: chromate transporter [Bacteroidaceae bacterium]|nr:chromate transporter [Bacteroidaceae bacterium]